MLEKVQMRVSKVPIVLKNVPCEDRLKIWGYQTQKLQLIPLYYLY